MSEAATYEVVDKSTAALLETIHLLQELARAKDEIIRSQQATISALTMPGGGSRLTVHQIYERFEAAMKARKSWGSMRTRLRAFVAVFGDSLAMTVTPPKWSEFRERRKVDDVICGNAIGALTINFELDWAKRMFSWSTEPEQNLLPSNPLEKAKREKVDAVRETWLTEKQLDQLLHHCSPLLAAFVLIAVDTGLRISELLTLRRDRLRYVELHDGRTFGVADISKRRTKSKRPHRATLTPRCLAALKLMPGSEVPHLFPSPRHPERAYSVRPIQKQFRAACVASGVDVFVADGDGVIRCHDLRRTAATAATRRGASLLQVQQLLNHSSPAITANYVQVTEDDMISIAALIDAGAAEERRGPRRSSPTEKRKIFSVA